MIAKHRIDSALIEVINTNFKSVSVCGYAQDYLEIDSVGLTNLSLSMPMPA